MTAREALRVLAGGAQATVQAGPRRGLRHLGVPTCGAADPVSLALANRLVGNAAHAPGIEATYGGVRLAALRGLSVGIVGASCGVSVQGADGTERPGVLHRTLRLRAGETLALSPARHGSRTYIAVAGGLDADAAFGSASTYLPAGFGGHEGRALRAGDVLRAHPGPEPETVETPRRLRAHFGGAWTLRATTGPEYAEGHGALFAEGWRAGACDRMGLRLDGAPLPASGSAVMDSVAVLPGTVQAPPGGAPIILGVDGGTTGGYPRAAQVIRADRHLIGQARPGDGLRLLRWRAEDADAVLADKLALLRGWVGAGFTL